MKYDILEIFQTIFNYLREAINRFFMSVCVQILGIYEEDFHEIILGFFRILV